MDLRRVECFVAVAELRSFRQAAERLHLSRSPLTRQVMALEREVGARLLDRDRGRAVTLTEAGHAFLTHVRPALESARAAVHHAREAARGNEGRLTIVGCGILAAPVLASTGCAATSSCRRRSWTLTSGPPAAARPGP